MIREYHSLIYNFDDIRIYKLSIPTFRFFSQRCSRPQKAVNKKIHEDAENENSKEAFGIISYLYNLLSSDTQSTEESSSFYYKVGSVSHIKQETTESKRNFFPLGVNLNNYEESEEYSNPLKNTEKNVDRLTATKIDVACEVSTVGEIIKAAAISKQLSIRKGINRESSNLKRRTLTGIGFNVIYVDINVIRVLH